MKSIAPLPPLNGLDDRSGPASLRRTRVAVRAGQYRVLYFSSRRVLHAGP
eukprot:SAG11_NODE_9723_length_885_cov_27.123410_1_plen_49_part_10